MEYIDLKETVTELKDLGLRAELQAFDTSKKPRRIVTEYTIGNPAKDISKAKTDTKTDQ